MMRIGPLLAAVALLMAGCDPDSVGGMDAPHPATAMRWVDAQDRPVTWAVTQDQIRLQVDLDLSGASTAAFEGRLVFDDSRLRLAAVAALRCEPETPCPSGLSATPHPFGDPVVEIAGPEVHFTLEAVSAAATGIVGLLEITFDVIAHGEATARLIAATHASKPAGPWLPVLRQSLNPLEIAARLAGRIVVANALMTGLYVVNPAATPATTLPIPATLAYYTQPAWSPDGQRIAFVGHEESMHGQPDIYVMNADGTGLINLTDGPSYDSDPAWSPDGRLIAFSSNRDGALNIFVMHADGSNPVNLTRKNRRETNPAWSPDGSRIVYMSSESSGYKIRVMKSDGSEKVTITKGFGSDAWPTWSPDGVFIAYSRSGQVYVVHPDGSGIRALAAGYFPNWTR